MYLTLRLFFHRTLPDPRQCATVVSEFRVRRSSKLVTIVPAEALVTHKLRLIKSIRVFVYAHLGVHFPDSASANWDIRFRHPTYLRITMTIFNPAPCGVYNKTLPFAYHCTLAYHLSFLYTRDDILLYVVRYTILYFTMLSVQVGNALMPAAMISSFIKTFLNFFLIRIK